MKKIFFFDIDGTLAIKGVIPKGNIEALKKLKEKGYLVFICTGRAPFYAKNMFKDLISGYVTCNGRYIIYQDKKLHGEVLSESDLNYYQNKISKLNCGALFMSDEKAYAFNLNQKQIEESKKEYGNDKISQQKLDQDFYTFDLFYQNIKQRDQLIAEFKDDLIINDHGGTGSCDCSTICFDKGSAIAYLLKYFEISKDQAYAFGDGYNDQAMFKEAGHCIAMGNAVDVLKEKATYVTDTIENDGILKALYHEKVI